MRIWPATLAIIALCAASILKTCFYDNGAVVCSAVAVVLLLFGGVGDWWRRRAVNRKDLILASSVTLLALAIRLSSDVGSLPGFIARDEITVIRTAAKLAHDWWSIFGVYWGSVPVFGVAPVALAFTFFDATLHNARFVHCLFGAGSVFALFYLAKELGNRRVGIVAAALLAVSFQSIAYSRIGHHFIVVSFFATVLMACSMRAFGGGSLLSWVGAALAMGCGVMGYQAGQLFPLVFLVSVIPFIVFADSSAKRWLSIRASAFIVGVGVLLGAPPLLHSLRWGRIPGLGRIRTLRISSDKLASLGESTQRSEAEPLDRLLLHVYDGFSVLWKGRDHLPETGAPYPFLDPVVGILVACLPLLFWRRWKVAWLCVSWIIIYLTVGVVMCAELTSYHRIVTLAVFTSLAAAMVCEYVLPRRLTAIAAGVVCLCSTYVNLNRYFVQEPKRLSPAGAQLWVAKQFCGYAKSHAIVDASRPEGLLPTRGFVEFIRFECKTDDYHLVPEPGKVWQLAGTQRDKVLVVVSSSTLARIGMSPPQGYEVVRSWAGQPFMGPEYTFVELSRLA